MNALLPRPTGAPAFVAIADLRESNPIFAGAPLDDDAFAGLRQRAVLDGCKWDPQVGDVATLARFPLWMPRATWLKLAGWAEQLTAEALAAEQEILARPQLLELLGLPGALRRLFRCAPEIPLTPAAVRVMRFDFHFTTEGWRISELNSDVPGGFTESSTCSRLMAEHFPGAQLTGSPIDEWSRAIAAAAGRNGVVALLSAPGFMEDHQIIAYLARHLPADCRAYLAAPQQILWRDSRAQLASAVYQGPVDAIVRFYQGEWLTRLPRSCEWQKLVFGGRTPVGNPGLALLSESKRLALIQGECRVPMPTWRRLLPETRDPRDADWARDDGWLLKTAFCNNGDTVSIRSRLDAARWKSVARAVRWHPEQWLAQRRFETVPVATPLGAMHPCIGVYTFNGKASGTYARITARPLIDYAAVDVPLLLKDDCH